MKKLFFLIAFYLTFALAHQYDIYDINGKKLCSYNGTLDKFFLTNFSKKNHGSILVKKVNTGNFQVNKIFNPALTSSQNEKKIDISKDSLIKPYWIEVEKNEIINICLDTRVLAWETSIESKIVNDSCLAIHAPSLTGVNFLNVYFTENSNSLKVNFAIGMKYLNFKNEDVLLGYNNHSKKWKSLTNIKEEDPERFVSITGTYLIDKYPVTNCEFTQLLWDSIPPKSTHVVKYAEFIQEKWVSRKRNSIHNGNCAVHDSAANMVYLLQAMKYANARSIREGLKPYYIFSSTEIDNESILSEGQYVIMSWDFNKHKEPYIQISIDKSSDGYRLPYYDEWMMFARGGDKKNKAPWGDGLVEFVEAAKYAKFGTAKKEFDSEPVGQLSPNGYGLYDVFGLVQEHVIFYKSNPFPPYEGHPACFKGGDNRVVIRPEDQKGEFESEPTWRRINYGYSTPNWGASMAGFRLIRNIDNNAKWTEIKSDKE